MWECVSKPLDLPKGPLWYVPLKLIWGFSWSEPWYHRGFLTQHCGCMILVVGGGVMKHFWVMTPTHPSWKSKMLMKCFITPLVGLCDFNCENHCIVTLLYLLHDLSDTTKLQCHRTIKSKDVEVVFASVLK